jgi:hypothetical protein
MRHTRATVLKRVEAEYQALDRIVKRLTVTDFRRPAMGEGAPIRFTAKDVLAHINAWRWNEERVLTKNKGPRRPFDPPQASNIRDTNAGIYRRSHRMPAATIIAEHRAAQRAVRKALRGLPSAYFERERSKQWPFDIVGHVAEHRRKHLEPLLLSRAATAPRGR